MTYSLGDIAISLALVIGGAFVLVGSIGLIKLRNPMSRLHAPTKAGTLGVGSILIASVIYSFAYGEGSLHELLIMIFLFVTAPVSAHFIAKVHIHRDQTEQKLPKPPADTDWATKHTHARDNGQVGGQIGDQIGTDADTLS
ncbi:multisubunit potassium/proton antiporter, PhaG subunit [Pseudooceanicola nitratireducens]|jgi:multicomponent K+:H+ antiporter subunit G|uniref:Multisubunit potassium/proton antiporter, PhaG subunit n=1 Tax=Pseudooceanicola nitratireducens TaxID=517719 RepID=A0A1I1Q6D9_9RHOB|nr:Na+/H+ antiporter subunit G [Pseudooceanicola nitratireducens]SEJ72329.1 multicomponent K+:H+ antiporter subunit G [Pseudooceanicola nitratireducens]SFD17674.1 multisubunit potassium/proton antiporter, PhaG subunit [Pseudooceanicola nitratireducens]